MVAIGEYRAPPSRARLALADRRVEVLGSGDLEALHSRCERRLVMRLHQQVHVRALDAELHDPEVLAPRGGQRGFADRLVDAAPPQIADGGDHPQRHVDRVTGVEIRPRLVRRPGPLPFRRTTCTAPLAAALLEQYQLFALLTLLASPIRGRCIRLHALSIILES